MITVYHSCFSTTGPFPDRPLPYSQAPSGCVRLLSIGTMRQLRLPCLSCVTPFVTLPRNTSVDFQLSLVRAGEIATRSPGCCLTGVTLCSGIWSQGRIRFSQVSCEPLVHLPCSQTPAGPPRQAMTAFRCCPRKQDDEGPNDYSTFGAQSHGFCTGCLRFVPFSRTTTQNSLPVVSQPFRVGFLIPTEFVWRVSALASSLPALILARLAPALALDRVKASAGARARARAGGGFWTRACFQSPFRRFA